MELVLVTPLLVVILLIVVALGRLAGARLVVADAAHQAARAATLARTDAGARTEAQSSAAAALSEAGSACTRPKVSVQTDGLRPGGTVTARVTCTADLGELSRTGMPGAVSLGSTAFSPVDTYRSTL
ncbi:TadE/TadG family type IV pilus assembly protein [Streptomyces sp. NPDC042319]|uniref:TadE/TadG family type IV pilus assembly protein n=1 Tax=Streptomyces sp. NPDC042319 TaxID=3154332 RepID=UPI003411B6CC